MLLFVEVLFYAGQRKHLPTDGYRPDAIFHDTKDYWGITFIECPIAYFDVLTLATIKFSFHEKHYHEVKVAQTFQIMEGFHLVGEGSIVSIEFE